MERIALDKGSMLPIYYQIAQQVKAYIAQQKLREGDVIPTERELCEAFGVSRMTVRQAVDILVGEGLLNRQRGRGTFISTPKISQPLTMLTSFTVDAVARGMTPSSRVISCQAVPASPCVAEKLNIATGETVVQLVRVRCANGEPHAHERTSLLHSMAAPLLTMDLAGRSLYQTLGEVCNLHLVRARESIEAKGCPEKICRLLHIPDTSIVFYIQRVTFDQHNCPVEYVEANYRTDKFRFEVELALSQD